MVGQTLVTRVRRRTKILVAAAVGTPTLLGLAVVALLARHAAPWRASGEAASLAGSRSCRGCHAAFYEKWAGSFHGRAMQPYTPEFARAHLTRQKMPITIAGRRYRAVVGVGRDHVVETGPEGTKIYPFVQVLGGKNVCYFLTPLERGRLQVLPLAYDVRRRAWFSTAGSAVRPFADVTDRELDWRDRAYTFNTSCFRCHVSQVVTNYDPASDSYHTIWTEPGVSCETCHGPASAHVQVFSSLRPGERPSDRKIVSVKSLGRERRNDLCASCHAKASAIETPFRPGDRFFDHFDLATLESPDYYPDGRDLGENYTFTSWRMSPCARSGQLDCVHCHTSSGRYRFQGRPNDACLPCHADRVANAARHSHHPGTGPGTRCTDCHMPVTEFARMRRSDHSMRPPAPAATRELGSPNACNLCHSDHDAAWAERTVRAWGGGRWSERILREGRLVAAARRGDWSRLAEMLRYLGEPGRDEIVTASLARLLAGCDDRAKLPVLRALATDASPLVRAAAVTGLEGVPEAREALLAATRDRSRLVRVRAAAALGGKSPETLRESARAQVRAAREELEQSFLARPDDFASQYALGNLRLEQGDPQAAAERYRKALTLRPDHVPSLVNLSLAEARLGRLDQAETALRTALRVEPSQGAAYFNLGLLLAEKGRASEARDALQSALALDPRNAGAAYNLALLTADSDPRQAATLAGRAAALAPEDPRYALTEALFLERAGERERAERTLRALVARHPGSRDGWALLGTLLEKRGRKAEAAEVYRRAAAAASLPADDRAAFAARLAP